MSKRKVLSVTRSYAELEQRYDFVTVVWGYLVAETKTTYKFDRIIATTYNRGVAIGHSAYMPRDVFSIYKKSKALPEHALRCPEESVQDAIRHVATRGQLFNARIRYFDNTRGEGLAEVFGYGLVPIYGCNAHNSLTGYAETSCITMKDGELFSCKLADMGTHVTCTDFTGTFDQERSNSLDHSKLAFKRKDGKFINGLFA